MKGKFFEDRCVALGLGNAVTASMLAFGALKGLAERNAAAPPDAAADRYLAQDFDIDLPEAAVDSLLRCAFDAVPWVERNWGADGLQKVAETSVISDTAYAVALGWADENVS